MAKFIIATLSIMLLTTLSACSQKNTDGIKTSDSGPASGGSAGDGGGGSAGREPSVSAKEFIETFTEAQQCVLAKTAELLSTSTAPDKPNADELKNFAKAVDEKTKDEALKNQAWSSISKGCNGAELDSIHNFMQCQHTACGKKDMKAAQACAVPTAGEGCKNSFKDFTFSFFPSDADLGP